MKTLKAEEVYLAGYETFEDVATTTAAIHPSRRFTTPNAYTQRSAMYHLTSSRKTSPDTRLSFDAPDGPRRGGHSNPGSLLSRRWLSFFKPAPTYSPKRPASYSKMGPRPWALSIACDRSPPQAQHLSPTEEIYRCTQQPIRQSASARRVSAAIWRPVISIRRLTPLRACAPLV